MVVLKKPLNQQARGPAPPGSPMLIGGSILYPRHLNHFRQKANTREAAGGWKSGGGQPQAGDQEWPGNLAGPEDLPEKCPAPFTQTARTVLVSIGGAYRNGIRIPRNPWLKLLFPNLISPN
jgi:hypothetical protein